VTCQRTNLLEFLKNVSWLSLEIGYAEFVDTLLCYKHVMLALKDNYSRYYTVEEANKMKLDMMSSIDVVKVSVRKKKLN